MANINIKIELGILFLFFSNTNIWFTKKEFKQKSYTITEGLCIKKQVKLVGKKKFAIRTLNLRKKAFIVSVALLLLVTNIIDLL